MHDEVFSIRPRLIQILDELIELSASVSTCNTELQNYCKHVDLSVFDCCALCSLKSSFAFAID